MSGNLKKQTKRNYRTYIFLTYKWGHLHLKLLIFVWELRKCQTRNGKTKHQYSRCMWNLVDKKQGLHKQQTQNCIYREKWKRSITNIT